jgi:hypothetical protein
MKYTKTKAIRQLLRGIALPLLMLALLAFPLPVSATGVTVSVDAPVEVTVGAEFATRVNITDVENLDAVVFRVRFDPEILDLPTTDADNNGIYDSVVDGEVGGKTVKVLTSVLKEPGLVGIVAEVEPFLSGTTGSGHLAELHFCALSSGYGDIGLEHYSLSDATAEEITARWIGSSVAVGVPPVTTPEATATSAPTQETTPAPTQEGQAPTSSEPAPTPTQEGQAPTSSESPPAPTPINWPFIGAIIGGVIVIAVVVLLVKRPRHD